MAITPLGIKDILDGLAELALIDWLHQRRHSLLIACDVAARSCLQSCREWPASSLVDVESIGDIVIDNDIEHCVVVVVSNERAWVQRLRDRIPGVPVHGLIADIACRRLAGLDNVLHVDDRRAADAFESVGLVIAVVASARSGSSMFCELLHRNGLSPALQEDLRPAVLFLQRHRQQLDFCLRHWLGLVCLRRLDGGVLATKVILQFALELIPLLDTEQLQELRQWIQGRSLRVIRLSRADLIAQAVSLFVAVRSQRWHFRDAEPDAEYRRRVGDIEYDFDAIDREYRQLRRQQEQLAALIDGADQEVLELQYESLCADPEATVAAVSGFLGVGFAEFRPASSYAKMADEHSRKLARRFARDIDRL